MPVILEAPPSTHLLHSPVQTAPQTPIHSIRPSLTLRRVVIHADPIQGELPVAPAFDRRKHVVTSEVLGVHPSKHQLPAFGCILTVGYVLIAVEPEGEEGLRDEALQDHVLAGKGEKGSKTWGGRRGRWRGVASEESRSS